MLGAAVAGPPSPVAAVAGAAPAELRVTTANILKDLGRVRARADLLHAMRDSDVVATQEMSTRRLDVTGWGRSQSTDKGACNEAAVYWRKSTLRHVSSRWVFLFRSTAFRSATRCVNVATLEDRATGRRFAVVDVHMIWHVEAGGAPRRLPTRINIYSRGMDTLDGIRRGLTVPVIIAGDWNVSLPADCRVLFAGFPCAHFRRPLDATHTPGTLGRRQVDVVWFRPDVWANVGDRVVGATFSDHDFARVRLAWRPR